MSRLSTIAQVTGRVLISATLCLTLLACQSDPYKWSDTSARAIENDLAMTRPPVNPDAPPPEVRQALLPPFPGGGSSRAVAPSESRFDLAVSNAPASQVFMGLVENTPYSMVVHPEVTGTMSLNLKNVTVDEAMLAIRRVYGFEFTREGSRYYVHGRGGLQSRVFPVNYLNLTRRGKSDTRVTSGELTQSTSGASTGGSGASTSERVSSIRVETDSQADFWKELKESLTTLIGTEAGRQLVVNPQASTVIVRAMPDELRLIEEYLGVTQLTLNRQVILEAKIIEVELSDGFQTGINWAKAQGNSTFSQTGGGQVFGGTGLSDSVGSSGNLLGVLPNGLATSAFGGVFSVATNAGNFSAFLELLKTQGSVHVLSSPRVSTVNNQKAVIKVGGDEFFITGVSNTPVTSGTTTALTTEIKLTPFFSGIALDVTPQIDDSANIILHIHPSVSEVTQRDKSYTINGFTSTLPLAASTIRESDNVVRAASGQIIVIGGLMKEGTTDDDASVPFFGDLPLVGNLFKHKQITRIKKELVIMLKPTIVDNGQVWGQAVDEVRDRVQNLKR
ncbi:MAG: pilus (MSHA type) biogenesis protein MshL [Gammaproteobacteria bacterium]|nr:pilus (MSHA type) biogenesis protein MshL [Gammaproteobacteria bacterium]